MLSIFGSLLERPIIKHDFDHKYPILLKLFNKSLDESKMIFDQHVKASAAQVMLDLFSLIAGCSNSVMRQKTSG